MKTGYQLNIREIVSTYDTIGKELEEKVRTAIIAATRQTSLDAKQFAPRSKVNVKYKRTGAGLISSIRTKAAGKTGEVIVGVEYGPYVEFGTGSKVRVPQELKDYAMQFKGKGIRNVNIRPQPYLYPAFFINRDRLIKKLNEYFEEILRRASR